MNHLLYPILYPILSLCLLSSSTPWIRKSFLRVFSLHKYIDSTTHSNMRNTVENQSTGNIYIFLLLLKKRSPGSGLIRLLVVIRKKIDICLTTNLLPLPILLFVYVSNVRREKKGVCVWVKDIKWVRELTRHEKKKRHDDDSESGKLLISFLGLLFL